ncbi:MAG TPA: hypothetical protein VM618_12410 [Acidimicrobiia bacterium]|nr:hypothetical protein [Acidimicrobiia bacterium]
MALRTASGIRHPLVRAGAVAVLAWGALVVAVYYSKLWAFLAGGPSAWADFAVFDGAFGAFDALPRAAARNVAAVVGATVTFAAVQGAGALAARGCRFDSPAWDERLAVRTSLGFAVLAFTALGLTALGLYTRWVLRIGVVVAAGLVAASLWRRRGQWRAGSVWEAVRSALPGQRAMAVVSAVAVTIAFVGALAPEREWDALWYHLGFLPDWLDEGRLAANRWEYPSLYPMTWELVFGTGMALGGSVAAKLLHFSCLPVLAALVHGVVRRHFPGTPPWLAVALFVTTPVVLWEATTAYVDLALALHLSVGLLALVRFASTRAVGWLAVASVSLGMAAATKHLALPAVAIMLAGLSFHLWRRERSWRSVAPAVVVVAGACLLLAGPWYLRAWSAAGNPVFPEMHGVFGADAAWWSDTAERGLDAFRNQFGRDRTPLTLLALPWDVTVHAARYGGTLGPLFLVLVPGLLLGRSARSARPVPWLAAFAAAFVLVWAAPFSSFQMRFLVPIVPVLAILGAAGAARIRDAAPPAVRTAAGVALVALLALNLPPFTPFHEHDRRGWQGWLTHVVHQIPLPVVVGAERESAYLARWVPAAPAWRYADEHLGEEALVLTFSGGDHLLSDTARIPATAVAAWPATFGAGAGEEGDAVAALRRLGVTHLLVDQRLMARTPVEELAIHPDGAMRHVFEPVYRDGRFVLFEIRWRSVLSGIPDQ